ncbi:MAG: glycoside hydrolase family 3 C-terminal domain-containing protein [Armatimonadetes bacterium]|nr:glycoside hydrolase family 3 C-terminal domain-containing protein [Armatimonadota bacterium]
MMWTILAATALANPAISLPAKYDSIFKRLTLEEKATLMHGSSGFSFGKLPSHNLPEIGMNDGPQGVRQGVSTAFPCAITYAATWDRDLIRKLGVALGQETKAAGNRVILGPAVNIMRTPLGGRTFEYMGEDPYLAGHIAAEYIKGVQSQGVAACVKHFTLNEQEVWRTTIDVYSSRRALEEIYAEPFRIAIQEGKVWSLMSAYNKVQGDYCTASPLLNQQLLRKEWGFDGVIMSDWGAWHDDKLALESGATLDMPSGMDAKKDQALADRVREGEISEEALNDAVRRNLLMASRVAPPDDKKLKNVSNEERAQIAKQVAIDGMVLLKNSNSLLPLDSKKLKRIAVIGPNADKKHTLIGTGAVGGGSGAVEPPYEITVLEGLKKALGGKVQVDFAPGFEFARPFSLIGKDYVPGGFDEMRWSTQDFTGSSTAGHSEKIDVNTDSNGGSYSYRWTGTLVAPRTEDLTLIIGSDDGSRLYADDKLLIDNWGDHNTERKMGTIKVQKGQKVSLKLEFYNSIGKGEMYLAVKSPKQYEFSTAVALAKGADAVVFVGGTDHSYDSEGWSEGSPFGADKPNLDPIGPQAEFINEIAKVNPKIAVVLINGAPISVEAFKNSAAAILEAWYPNQEGGSAVADVLLGHADPGGRLPVTFGKKLEDWRSHQFGMEGYPGTEEHGKETYKDDIWVGYRWFDHARIEPSYPFGFGLSYTTFKMADFKLTATKTGWVATCSVTNTGKRAGSHVVQIYVQNPASQDRAIRELKGFSKVHLKAGESAKVSIPLDKTAFRRYDESMGDWVVPGGKYQVLWGNSSVDFAGSRDVMISQK